MIKKSRPSLLNLNDTTALAESNFSASARAVLLPAAARAAEESSPTGNTGNPSRLMSGKRARPTEEQLAKEARYKFFSKEVANYPSESLVIVDWLTLTFGEKDPDLHTVIISNLYDMLEDAGISIIARSRGLYNYDNSAQLKIISDLGADVSVGNIAHSERQGVMLELSGAGCEAMRSTMRDLYVFAQVHTARITRVDLALDLSSEYCTSTGFTVPRQGMLAQNGDYASNYGSKKQSISTVGAWNDLLFGGVSCDDYDPLKHASGGLTLYVGANTSENQIVIYEKGKQLLGGIEQKDLDLIMSDYRRVSERKRNSLINNGFDPYYLDKRAWVRIERRIRRGGHKKDIPLAFMLDPDSAFCLDFPRLSDVYASYADYVQREIDLVEYRAQRKANAKNILISGKIFWAKRQYGRLVQTLFREGFTAEEIFTVLAREQGLKDFVFDIQNDQTITALPPEKFDFEDYLSAQERSIVSQIRTAYAGANTDDAFGYRKNPLYTRLVCARVADARND